VNESKQLSRAEKMQLTTTVMLRRARKARTDFVSFILYVWTAADPTFELADFHREAIAAYCNPSLKYVYWEAPRGHAKSLLTTAYAAWCLGRNPNERIKIICANDKEARKRLDEIKEHLQKNMMLRLTFPDLVRDPKGDWNKSRIRVKRTLVQKDPSIESMGVMSGSLGSRATLMIFDDIVDMRNAVLQPQLREHVRQKVFGEILPLLEPGGRTLAVGTPWTLRDVNATMRESQGWFLVGPHRVGTKEDPFAPIWTYKFTREELVRRYASMEGRAEFARAYWCQALTKDTVPIQAQWIKYYNAQLLGDPYNLFCMQAYDLAIGQNPEHDWFAGATILWDEERRFVFVADGWHDKISFRQQSKRIVGDANDWNPQAVVIEHGGYQGALSSYLAEDTKRPLSIWPFRNRGRSKERRMVEASPWFEKGRVFFHPKFDIKTNPDIRDTGDMVGEITSFPFGVADDMSDAIVMGLLTITEMMPDDDDDNDDFDMEDGLAVRVTSI
jgi:phage terminase large subunit-like protein